MNAEGVGFSYRRQVCRVPTLHTIPTFTIDVDLVAHSTTVCDREFWSSSRQPEIDAFLLRGQFASPVYRGVLLVEIRRILVGFGCGQQFRFAKELADETDAGGRPTAQEAIGQDDTGVTGEIA